MSYLKTLLIICPIFFISGIIDSIGGGGGLIALPTYLMIGLPVRSAYGCNKLQAGLGNLVSAIKYFKNNMVDLRIALVSAITAMTGAWISPSGGEHSEGHHGGTSGDRPHYGSQKD